MLIRLKNKRPNLNVNYAKSKTQSGTSYLKKAAGVGAWIMLKL